MAVNYINTPTRFKADRTAIVGLVLMAVVCVVVLFLVAVANGALESYPYLYLLPWIAGLAIVLATPSVILYYRGKFTFADPIVFATWSYFFPAFVIGGIFLAGGWSQPWFLFFIQDAEYNLPLTIVLVALGFAGLVAGYYLPIGVHAGAFVAKRLPTADYQPSAYIVPGILLLILGIINTILAFALGVFGFQHTDEIGMYDGIIFLTTLFWLQGSFLLWNIIFRQKNLNAVHVLMIVLLVGTAVSKSLFAGNRGSVIQIFSVIALAYILAGRRFRLKHTIVAGSVLTVLMIAGMIYGSTFRIVKGSEEQQSLDQYAENVLLTLDQVTKSDTSDLLQYGFSNLTERIDIVSTLAVVVSNYEQLAPYEEAYGIDNNIWKDSITFYIPRVVWEDKPYASDPRKYSDLYFNFGETSFAITPMGDLLRNYGIIGVPIGMLILGIILRFIYRALVEDQTPNIWRMTFYFMLLTSVSYEGFYGTIVPFFFKVGFTAAVGLVLVCFLAKAFDKRLPVAAPPI
jgi:hypothetical protein